MERILIVFYILFFASGFMGGTALLLLGMRIRTRMVQPLLVMQIAFMVATGLMVAYFVARGQPGGVTPTVEVTLIVIIMLFSIAVWSMVWTLTRRLVPPPVRGDRLAGIVRFLVSLGTAAAILDLAFFAAAAVDHPVLYGETALSWWDLGSMILFGLGMAGFGVAARTRAPQSERAPIRSLLRMYGLITIIFAPIGVVEYAIESASIPWLGYISLDHLFFAAWNVVSLTAAVHVFRPPAEKPALMTAVPENRVRELRLSTRETEIALLIARGLTNKEMAAELHISPATVRTHIYNLYQKAGARSRVELINALHS